jgi:hypothetical protein
MVAKRHHFVPKRYLESFSVKNAKKKKSNLYAFDAVERKVFRPAPEGHMRPLYHACKHR